MSEIKVVPCHLVMLGETGHESIVVEDGLKVYPTDFLSQTCCVPGAEALEKAAELELQSFDRTYHYKSDEVSKDGSKFVCCLKSKPCEKHAPVEQAAPPRPTKADCICPETMVDTNCPWCMLETATPRWAYPQNVTLRDEKDLLLHGHAGDPIWCMENSDGLIGVRLDDGDSGTVYLTKEQAQELSEQLAKMTAPAAIEQARPQPPVSARLPEPTFNSLFTCGPCQKSFKIPQDFLKHITEKHPAESAAAEPAPTPSRADILQQIQSDIHYEATHKKGLAWLVLTIEKRIEAEA